MIKKRRKKHKPFSGYNHKATDAREPNGRRRRNSAKPDTGTPEVQQRRSLMIALSSKDCDGTQESFLLHRGDITETQMKAARRLFQIDAKWRSLVGLRPRRVISGYLQPLPPTPPEIDESRVIKIKSAIDGAEQAAGGKAAMGIVLSMLEWKFPLRDAKKMIKLRMALGENSPIKKTGLAGYFEV